MKDPVKDAFTELGDKTLIFLDELKWVIFDKQFWLGTLTFIAILMVILMDGYMRREV